MHVKIVRAQCFIQKLLNCVHRVKKTVREKIKRNIAGDLNAGESL
jgi:hypothetical protein